jgi:hypothetical protein
LGLFRHAVTFEVETALPVIDAFEQACSLFLTLFTLQVHDYLHCVLEYHLDQSACDGRGVVHGGGAVDFDKPGIELLINHEIVADELKAVMSADYLILRTDDGRYDHLPHPCDDFLEFALSEGRFYILHELLVRPHRLLHELLRVDFAVVLLDRVVGEMGEFVVEFGRVVFLQAEPEVELGVDPYFGRGVVFDQYPLSDIELASVDDEWILDVFLHDELCFLVERVVEDVGEFRDAFDASSSRKNCVGGWLQAGLTIQMLLLPLRLNWGSRSKSLFTRLSTFYFRAFQSN